MGSLCFRRRIELRVRSDNMSARTLLLLLRARGIGLNLIVREIALDLGDCAFIPSRVEHLPGVANGLSDSLSRRIDPKKQPGSFPASFKGVWRIEVSLRDTKYYTPVL